VGDKKGDESGSNSKLADEFVDLVNTILETLTLGEDGGRCRDLGEEKTSLALELALLLMLLVFLGGDNVKNAPRSLLNLGRGALYDS